MNYWKVTNLSNQPSKLIIGLSPSTSKGLILNPGQFCICTPKQTPVMDAQIRRGLISVEKNFDNSLGNFEIGKTYYVTELNKLKQISDEEDKMRQAKTDAENYANNNP